MSKSLSSQQLDTYDWNLFMEENKIMINDTQPALAIVELFRILIDEELLPWEEAWAIVSHSVHFTSHSHQSEAAQIWPVSLIEKVLPRHLELIYLMNH